MHSDLFRLFKRLLILGSPLLALVVVYAWCDPFKVLYNHEQYYGPQERVSLNRDFVSTQLYTNQPTDSRADSFIFGNSRSLAFLCSDWKKHIESERVFHFDASGETLFGIWSKVKFIDETGDTIKHALVIIDSDTLSGVSNSMGHLFEKDPRVSGESGLMFQLSFFRAFLARGFFIKYLDFRYSGTFRRYMDGAIEAREFQHNRATNDLVFESVEAELKLLGDAYFSSERGVFPPRDRDRPLSGRPVVSSAQEQMLEDIYKIFHRHGTDYQIVVSPLYDQVSLNTADLRELRRIFSAERVFDFSGVNDLTSEVSNYYEVSHYRPTVAREIMRRIYADRNTENQAARAFGESSHAAVARQ